MNTETAHPLKVFLCHASGDKPPVRDLYKRLVAEGVDAWLDQERLLPGQDWRLEIPKAVQKADVVVICLSKKSITKEGYVQKEIKFALDIAEEKPEGTIFLIPARLEDCAVPERLSRWHWVDLYEENGFVKLLRSLKLRADAVGATIEPTSYEDTDKETERRLKQLYTEGLAAFYTEDWDKACHRFQSILSEQPSHKNATEKLAEAERQRNLSKLYEQATGAVRSEEWGTAIKTLEELSQKSADYKDASSLLRNTRKQKQLKDLYAEAGTLHDAQKWDAVLKVFEQIAAIEPNYPDLNGLLPSAQKEVAELKRLAELNELYGNAVSEMDAGHWIEARQLLEKVHKSQTGFLETERLLRKVENEIIKVEEQSRRNEQINVLYEQAHGFVRSQKWRKALDKIEEIEKLDTHFEDKDGIAQKARTELEREESEAQRQNQLAATYAEAVRLLNEEKYQEALDKWQEVRVVDPKYPDREWVGRTAKRKLAETAKPAQIKPKFVMDRSLWAGMIGFIVVGAVMAGVILSGGEEHRIPSTPTSSLGGEILTTPPATAAIPTSTLEPGVLYREDFETGAARHWALDPGWEVARDGNNYALMGEDFQFAEYTAGTEWTDYLVRFRLKLLQGGIHLDYRRVDNSNRAASVTSAGYFVEFRGNYLSLSKMISGDWIVRCGKDVKLTTNTWHDVEVVVDQSDFMVYLDGALALQCPDTDPVRGGTIWFNTMKDSKAMIDDIEVESMSTTGVSFDLTIYDDFDDPLYPGSYNTNIWTKETSSSGNTAGQTKGGVMTLVSIGHDNFIDLYSKKYTKKTLTSRTFIKSYFMKSSQQQGGVGLVVRMSEIGAFVTCYIWGDNPGQSLTCEAVNFGEYKEISNIPIDPGSWHTAYIEVDPNVPEFTLYVDGSNVGSYSPPQPERYQSVQFNFFIMSFCSGSGCTLGDSDKVEGVFDYVEIGPVSTITNTPGPGTQQPQPPALNLRVNYGANWVESFYEAGHKVLLKVTESDGVTIKATAELTTQSKEEWQGQEGFQTRAEDWKPNLPDIRPYDWVYAQVDNGATAKAQLGDIQGEVNLATNSITWTIVAPWLTDPVTVECLDWGSGGNPINKDGGAILTNGAEYLCNWNPETEWDIQPGQSVGVGYVDPDGHWVANVFVNPTLRAHPGRDAVDAWNWRRDVQINLTIDDPATPEQPDFEMSKSGEFDPSLGSVWFEFAGVYDLKAGDVVTMTDGVITQRLIVSVLAIKEVDFKTDIIKGSAEPGATVELSMPGALLAATDNEGNWVANFAEIGLDVWPGTKIIAEVYDEDGDLTSVEMDVP